MSLKIFHIVFVTLSVLLSLGFSKWCWQKTGEGLPYLLGTIAALVFAALLLIYGGWFWKKIRNLSLKFFQFFVFCSVLQNTLACSVCYESVQTPLLKGAELAVWFMLLVVFGMLSAFGVFMWRLKKRALAHSLQETP
jgi:predicted permease